MSERPLDRLVHRVAQHEARPAEQVSTIELFFDLVFVFAITQLTALVAADPTWRTIGRALLELCVLWWMYDGYAWLTNAVRPDTVRVRLVLLSAMAAFFVVALAIPNGFGRDGLTFAVAYLLIILLHASMFLRSGMKITVRAVLGLAPYNVAGAALVLVAGFVRGWSDWVLWPAALVVYLIPAVRGNTRGFRIQSEHFVERHGLLMLIAFGESVVAAGIGASTGTLSFGVTAGAVLGLAVSAGLWWCYFDGDDELAAQRLAEVPEERRALVALIAFGGWHLVMIVGVILLAAGVRISIHDVDTATTGPAPWLLAAGVAVYLAGDAAYRRTLRLGSILPRLVAAAAALLTVVAGRFVAPALEMALLAGTLAAMIVYEHLRARREAGASDEDGLGPPADAASPDESRAG